MTCKAVILALALLAGPAMAASNPSAVVTVPGAGPFMVTPTSNTTTVDGVAPPSTTFSISPTPPPPPPPPVAASCTLAASPASITAGGSSKLSWTTANATSFSVNQGVGTLTPVASGSVSVSPSATVAYSGTAVGSGGNGTCNANITVNAAPPPPPPATGTINITAGGTYTGNWISTNVNTAAVTISTTAPVELLNCTIQSVGDGIRTAVNGAQLTVHGCTGTGLNPMINGQTRGMFINATQTASLTVENNSISEFAFGIYDDGNYVSSQIVIQYNNISNLDGCPSNGLATPTPATPTGGRNCATLQFGQDNGNHAIMLAGMLTTYAEVAWNQITEAPYDYALGDIINIYRSLGTSASAPIEVHDNYIYGGYSARISTPGPCCSPPNGNTMEAITVDGAAGDTATTTSAFVHIFNNQVINNGGIQAIGINAGHDNIAWGNVVISTGQLTDGTWMNADSSNPLTIGNWTYNQPTNVFFNNYAYNNQTAWLEEGLNSAGTARVAPAQFSSPYLVGCAVSATGVSLCTGNVNLASPTAATENAQTAAWAVKLTTNGLHVGTP